MVGARGASGPAGSEGICGRATDDVEVQPASNASAPRNRHVRNGVAASMPTLSRSGSVSVWHRDFREGCRKWRFVGEEHTEAGSPVPETPIFGIPPEIRDAKLRHYSRP